MNPPSSLEVPQGLSPLRVLFGLLCPLLQFRRCNDQCLWAGSRLFSWYKLVISVRLRFPLSSGPGCPKLGLKSQHSPPLHYREKTSSYDKCWWLTNALRFLTTDDSAFTKPLSRFGIETTALLCTVGWFLGWVLVLSALILIRESKTTLKRTHRLCRWDCATTNKLGFLLFIYLN